MKNILYIVVFVVFLCVVGFILFCSLQGNKKKKETYTHVSQSPKDVSIPCKELHGGNVPNSGIDGSKGCWNPPEHYNQQHNLYSTTDDMIQPISLEHTVDGTTNTSPLETSELTQDAQQEDEDILGGINIDFNRGAKNAHPRIRKR